MDTKTIILLSREFYLLSKNLLKYANTGTHLGDYLHILSNELKRFTGCAYIGLTTIGEKYNYSYFSNPDSNLFNMYKNESELLEKLDVPGYAVIKYMLKEEDIISSHITDNKNIYIFDTDLPLTIGKNKRKAEICIEAPYNSGLFMKFDIDEEHCAVLLFGNEQRDSFLEDELEYYENIVTTIGVAIANRRAQNALRERIKELTCLYNISKLMNNDENNESAMMTRIIQIIKPAFQKPEFINVEIDLNGNKYRNKDFKRSETYIKAIISENGNKRGFLRVFLTLDNNNENIYFLDEERELIETISSQIGLIVEKKQSLEDNKQLESQLRHADRLATIGQLAAGVAHELNEPLGSILGFAQLIEKSYELPEGALRDCDRIIKGALHAREIIKKLMLFAKQMPPKEDYVNINNIVEESILFLEKRIKNSNCIIETFLNKEMPPIIADASQLYQVMMNLIVNAVQAMPNGGCIKINTGIENNQVFILIKDNGTGISENILEKIFLPFFTTKDINEGTGLGLPVVHGIISAHKGTITVKSEINKGTEFKVCLPINMESQ